MAGLQEQDLLSSEKPHVHNNHTACWHRLGFRPQAGDSQGKALQIASGLGVKETLFQIDLQDHQRARTSPSWRGSRSKLLAVHKTSAPCKAHSKLCLRNFQAYTHPTRTLRKDLLHAQGADKDSCMARRDTALGKTTSVTSNTRFTRCSQALQSPSADECSCGGCSGPWQEGPRQAVPGDCTGSLADLSNSETEKPKHLLKTSVARGQAANAFCQASE